ncbi:MAG: hypothetical protein AB7O96_13045 [Pseudobdellovibrionaceae bacterium]
MRVILLTFVCAFSVHAQAASIAEIFESISNTALEGNGDGHYVTEVDPTDYHEAREMRKLAKEVKSGDDCRFDIEKGVKDGITSIREEWSDVRTANRLEGLAKKGLIKQIIWSSWDPNTGDSEYCLKSSVKVYAVNGSVLVLRFNETD